MYVLNLDMHCSASINYFSMISIDYIAVENLLKYVWTFVKQEKSSELGQSYFVIVWRYEGLKGHISTFVLDRIILGVQSNFEVNDQSVDF